MNGETIKGLALNTTRPIDNAVGASRASCNAGVTIPVVGGFAEMATRANRAMSDLDSGCNPSRSGGRFVENPTITPSELAVPPDAIKLVHGSCCVVAVGFVGAIPTGGRGRH